MLNEGLYGLHYQAATVAPDVVGSGLVVLRDGKIIGTDRCGSVFIGDYEYDKIFDMSRISVRMQVPPDGELVTGFAAGMEGATIDIVAALEKAAANVATTVDVAGQPVIVKLTYIGPLPS